MSLVHCAEATQIQQFIMDKCKSHFCNTKIKSANISKYQTDILWSNAWQQVFDLKMIIEKILIFL